MQFLYVNTNHDRRKLLTIVVFKKRAVENVAAHGGMIKEGVIDE